MGFKKLFKVKQLGNGSKFEERVKGAIQSARSKVFPSLDNSRNSGSKKEVK